MFFEFISSSFGIPIINRCAKRCTTAFYAKLTDGFTGFFPNWQKKQWNFIFLAWFSL
ncbi:hypothetical protein ADIS_4028 [Lunatimonas lonarensis]|uniref:Uncharacterized protein n=1 Tax=Lunatimonas lonarensis TaxID=1232681 RepID=R7ZNE4_9BACT|nr:hypothetical protein ADIS_4028 [Lunatimonas lonarensis]